MNPTRKLVSVSDGKSEYFGELQKYRPFGEAEVIVDGEEYIVPTRWVREISGDVSQERKKERYIPMNPSKTFAECKVGFTSEQNQLVSEFAKRPEIEVFSFVTGWSREETSARMLALLDNVESSNGFNLLSILANLVGKEFISTASGARDEDRKHVEFSDRFPSLHSWSTNNSNKVAVLRSGNHFAYVAFGVVLVGRIPEYARITHAIEMMEIKR